MSEAMSPLSTAAVEEVITPAPEEALPNVDDIEESAIVKDDVVKDEEEKTKIHLQIMRTCPKVHLRVVHLDGILPLNRVYVSI